jgi:hypothetical protein
MHNPQTYDKGFAVVFPSENALRAGIARSQVAPRASGPRPIRPCRGATTARPVRTALAWESAPSRTRNIPDRPMDSGHFTSAAALLLACAALALTLNAVAADVAPDDAQAVPEAPRTAVAGPGGFVGYTGRIWAADYGITRGCCDRAAVARALSDPANATPGGGALAALAGVELDDADLACAALALEVARNGCTVAWSSGGTRHAFTASRDSVRGVQPCRGFVLRTTGAKAATVRGVPCQPDGGVWSVAAP